MIAITMPLPGSKDIDLEDLSYLSSGIYLLRVSGEDGFTEMPEGGQGVILR